MTCRHSANDPACSKNKDYVAYRSSAPTTPDAERFQVIDAREVGKHLILKVKYPNCASCSYEGTKVLVFFNVKAIGALKWRKIDPHFSDKKRMDDEAPSPAARFPASVDGWNDAITCASMVK
jgi:hypothetical protein